MKDGSILIGPGDGYEYKFEEGVFDEIAIRSKAEAKKRGLYERQKEYHEFYPMLIRLTNWRALGPFSVLYYMYMDIDFSVIGRYGPLPLKGRF
ncbi:MAG: hypothetical protein GY841_20040 [FCB group bacterium]|nr:hypothetical protein [FCB group bacterium]